MVHEPLQCYTQRGYGVTVTELDAQRREKTRLQAREAWFDEELNGWQFRDGRETWIDPESGEVQRTLPFEEHFVGHYREDPKLILVFDQRPKICPFLNWSA